MRRDARIAGILYILLGVIAPVRLIYIQNAVVVMAWLAVGRLPPDSRLAAITDAAAA